MYWTFFWGGPKANNMKVYHAVTAAVCAAAKRPGGLTVGHPYGTQSLEFTLEGGTRLIKKWMLKIYSETAGLDYCIFNIMHGAGFSYEKIQLCV